MRIIKFTAIIGVVCLCLASLSSALDRPFIIQGENPGDQFGDALTAFDFNGDSFDDYIIAATASDAGGTSSGKIYIYFGGPSADSIADMTINGPESSFFGSSLANAGDFNGDGFDDLLVGAPFYSGIALRAGAAYLFYGGPDADANPDLAFFGTASLDYFGTAVAGSFDFNDDDRDDIAVGVYKADYGSYDDAGLVNVFYGSDTPDTVTDIILTGEADGERFGYSLAGGDFNGDRIGDIVVGAYSFDDDLINRGRFYIFNGGAAPDSLFDAAVSGETDGSYFSYALTAADINNDDFDDVIAGAYGFRIGDQEAGKIYLYNGETVFDTLATFEFSLGRESEDHLGMAVTAGVDFDADGYNEFWAGLPGSDSGGIDAGGGIIFGGFDYFADTTLYGDTAEESFGHAGIMSVDFFGYGQPSVANGAYAYDNFRGRVYFYRQDNSELNQPPVLDPIGDKVIPIDVPFTLNVTAYDPDGTIPNLATSGPLPAGASFTDNFDGSGTFEWTPADSQIGFHPVTFYADDGEKVDSEQVTIEVADTVIICGDANDDSLVNVGDAVYILNYVFKGGPEPVPYCIGDANVDTLVNVGDVVYLINYVFRDGSPPPDTCCD